MNTRIKTILETLGLYCDHEYHWVIMDDGAIAEFCINCGDWSGGFHHPYFTGDWEQIVNDALNGEL